MSDQRNLLIAIVLSMVVVFGWQFFIGVPKPPPARPAQTTQQQAPGAAPKPATTPNATQLASNLPPSGAAASSPRATIDTPALQGSINLTGGRFDDLKLRKYRETPDP